MYYALGNHELDYIGTAEGKKIKAPGEFEGGEGSYRICMHVLEEGYQDVEIGGC